MANADRVFEALADGTRRTVFMRLRKGPRSVGELAEGLLVSRPAVSQHLRVLKEAQLVVDRAEGNRRLYMVNPRGIELLRGWLDNFWDGALTSFQKAAEAEASKERNR